MVTDWNDDDRLLADLGDALRAGREVPDRFTELGRTAFAWRTVDAELAALSYDSAVDGGLATVRAEPAPLRALTFVASALTIELEVTEDALAGQLVPAQSGEIEVQVRDGAMAVVTVDEVGWFTVSPRPAGLFRLRVVTVDVEILTEWTQL